MRDNDKAEKYPRTSTATSSRRFLIISTICPLQQPFFFFAHHHLFLSSRWAYADGKDNNSMQLLAVHFVWTAPLNSFYLVLFALFALFLVCLFGFGFFLISSGKHTTCHTIWFAAALFTRRKRNKLDGDDVYYRFAIYFLQLFPISPEIELEMVLCRDWGPHLPIECSIQVDRPPGYVNYVQLGMRMATNALASTTI